MTEEAVLKIDHRPFLDVALEVRLIIPQFIEERANFRRWRRMDHPRGDRRFESRHNLLIDPIADRNGNRDQQRPSGRAPRPRPSGVPTQEPNDRVRKTSQGLFIDRDRYRQPYGDRRHVHENEA